MMEGEDSLSGMPMRVAFYVSMEWVDGIREKTER